MSIISSIENQLQGFIYILDKILYFQNLGYAYSSDYFGDEVFIIEKEIGSENEDRYGDSSIKTTSYPFYDKKKYS